MIMIINKYLIVSGCSWTDKNYRSAPHPNLNCDWPKWPEILAKKLRMECINLAESGQGQEFIYSSLLDTLSSFKPIEIGLVIAAWTKSARRDFSYTYKNIKGEWANDDNYISKRYKTRWNSYLFDNKGDDYYFLYKSLRYQYSISKVCEALNIPLKHFQMLEPYETADYGLAKENYKNNPIKRISGQEYYNTMLTSHYGKYLDNSQNFIGFPGQKMYGGLNGRNIISDPNDYISDEDGHPNKKGHKKIAEFIYENL